MFSVFPLIASVLQAKLYGLSLINSTIAAMALLLYLFALKDMNETYARANDLRIELLTAVTTGRRSIKKVLIVMSRSNVTERPLR